MLNFSDKGDQNMENLFQTLNNLINDSAVVEKIKEIFSIDKNDKIRIAVIGQTGVGKTSTINALFNTNLPVSHFGSCTQSAESVVVTTPKGTIELIDMPGLWAGEAESIKHWKTYREVLPTVDSAIWIVSAGDRALEGMQNALRIISDFSDSDIINHIVFGVNKSEHMHPEDWNNLANLPSEEQEKNLEEFCITVKKAINEKFPDWNGVIKYYSAKKQFRLEELLEQMLIMASPDNRLKVYRVADPKSHEEKIEDKRALELAKEILKRGE